MSENDQIVDHPFTVEGPTVNDRSTYGCQWEGHGHPLACKQPYVRHRYKDAVEYGAAAQADPLGVGRPVPMDLAREPDPWIKLSGTASYEGAVATAYALCSDDPRDDPEGLAHIHIETVQRQIARAVAANLGVPESFQDADWLARFTWTYETAPAPCVPMREEED